LLISDSAREATGHTDTRVWLGAGVSHIDWPWEEDLLQQWPASRSPARARARAVRCLACVVVWLGPIAASGLGSSVAHAGNDDGVLVGGQAALTGGAVTATVSDGTAAWYNPAGLAHLQRPSLDLNASVYGFNWVSAQDLLTVPDGTQQGASVIDWVLLPAALSYSRVLSPDIVASFGIFIPKTSDFTLQEYVADSQGTRWTVGFDRLQKEYDYILTTAIRMSDTLRVGFALHGIYISTEETTQIGAGNMADASAPFLVDSSHRTTGDYGVRVGLGVQWAPRPDVEAGISLQTPTLTGLRQISSSTLTASTAEGGSHEFASTSENGLKSVWEFSTPLSVRAGVAFTRDRAQILFDGTLTSSLKSDEAVLSRKWHGNARVAGLWRVSDQLTAGLGVFSDLNATEEPAANYIGTAGGLRLSTDYRIEEGTRPLTFITTLGGRYAYGFGQIAGVRVNAEGETLTREEQAVSAYAHELAFNLGWAVTF
jgi:hypothetical protein